MSTFLVWLNIFAAGVVFVHCVCSLSVRRWARGQYELWVYSVLCCGAVGVICHGLVQGGVYHLSEIIVNCGIAAYFLSQTWRRRKINRKKS